MKIPRMFLSGAAVFAATSGGAVAFLVARGHTRYTSGAGDLSLDSLEPEMSEKAILESYGVFSSHLHTRGQLLSRNNGMGHKTAPPDLTYLTRTHDEQNSSGVQGLEVSFLQLQSEEAGNADSESEEGGPNTVNETEGGKGDSGAPEEEAESESENLDKGTLKRAAEEKTADERKENEPQTVGEAKTTKEDIAGEGASGSAKKEESTPKNQESKPKEDITSSVAANEVSVAPAEKSTPDIQKGTEIAEGGQGLQQGRSEAEHDNIDAIIARLRSLLKASKDTQLIEKLSRVIALHEKALEAKQELEKQTTEVLGTKDVPQVNAKDLKGRKDLLLTQQLSNMWVLPFYNESKRQSCLSGFEKMTQEATLSCADPNCFKIETQAATCSHMHINSIIPKEELLKLQGSSSEAMKTSGDKQKDHMLLGFDGECKKPEDLGKEIMKMLQRPKTLAERHALEQTTGESSPVSLQKHYVDLICDSETKAEYPACKTVYQALEHFSKPMPIATPELLILTDIADLKNTLGLYRITFLFEGLVPFADPDGAPIDAFKHKLPAGEARFMHEQRHEDISKTVLLKAT